jgi:hypothetical protein
VKGNAVVNKTIQVIATASPPVAGRSGLNCLPVGWIAHQVNHLTINLAFPAVFLLQVS